MTKRIFIVLFISLLSCSQKGVGELFPGIDRKWTIAIAKIDRIKFATKPDEVMQRGTVNLHIRTMLFGTPLAEVELPFSYVKRSLWNTKNREIRIELPSTFEETIWPELDTVKDDDLLVVINPAGLDPTTLVTIRGPVAVWVQRVSGKDDPAVSKLLDAIKIH